MKRLLLLAALALAACATLPPETAPEREIRDAATCAQVGPCIPIPADNQLFNDATIYLNGTRVGEVPGNSHRTLWMRKSLLVEGNCIYAQAVFRATNTALGATRECGQGFRITIGIEGYLWVNAQ